MMSGEVGLKMSGNGTMIRLKVYAGSKTASIVKKGEDAYEAWVRAPVGRGQANKAALKLVAEALGLEVENLRIAHGRKSPDKIVEVL